MSDDHDPVEQRLAALRQATDDVRAPPGLAASVLAEIGRRAASADRWGSALRDTGRAVLALAAAAALVSGLTASWYERRVAAEVALASQVEAEDEP